MPGCFEGDMKHWRKSMGLKVLTAYRAKNIAPGAGAESPEHGPNTIVQGEAAGPTTNSAAYMLGGARAPSRQHPVHPNPTSPAWPTTGTGRGPDIAQGAARSSHSGPALT